MKEPKYVKYEDDTNDNQGKRYNFFAEGLFPEKEDEKKLKNKSSQKKQQKYPFSIPNEEDKRRISNTQKDDLLPFFAKNYPSSSESKEDICFINTPAPSNSNSYSGGEAEEVEGLEEEDEKNEKIEEKKLDNEDIGLSVDFNSEIEAEQERQSKTMTREEILSRIKEKKKKDDEEKRKKEEERKRKEEEEKKRKEEEERKRKEEEEKKRKEEEERKKKEKEEKMLRDQEIKKQKEEEKRKKENEEKRRKELSKKKREERKRIEQEKLEQEKKLEEEKKKKNESGNKADKFNLLSSIKKNNNDNSYIASNSIINEVKQIFPETIPEENDGEDDDFSKKNFRGSSKKKISNKNSKKENKINNNSKKSKKVSNFNDNLNKYKNNKKTQSIKSEDGEDGEEEEEDENTKKKDGRKAKKTKSQVSSKVSRKSNGLGVEYNPREIIKKISEEDDVSQLSNYGDELIDAEDKINNKEEKEEYDSDNEPKKRKVKKNDKKKSKPKKRKNSKQKRNSKIKTEYTDRELEIGRYNALDKVKTYAFIPKEKEEKTFGNGRYSLRNRISTLNHVVGEKAVYTYIDGLPTLTEVNLSNRHAFSEDLFLREKAMKNRKKKKKLVKSSDLDDKLEDISEENEYNSELLESQDISEYGDDDARFLKIPKGGKKSKAKNYDTLMIIKVHDAQGRNMIRVDDKEYKDLKTGDEVRVNQNQVFEILNFSDYHLIVQLLFDYED